MKLLCIDNGPMLNPIGKVRSAPELIENEYYTVKREGLYGYELVEVETPKPNSLFNKKRFIPTSDIDEVEEVEKLLRYLESDFYETFISRK